MLWCPTINSAASTTNFPKNLRAITNTYATDVYSEIYIYCTEINNE